MEIQNKKWSNKKKVIFSIQCVTALAMLLFLVWFSVDCAFISRGVAFQESEFILTWDEKLYNASKTLATIFLVAGGLVLGCNIGYLTYRAFNFKNNVEKNTYGVVINGLIFVLGLATIIVIADYIKRDIFVCTFVSVLGFSIPDRLTHIDFLNWISAFFVIVSFSLVITWKKKEKFSIQYIEQDIKSVIRVFGIAPILFYPFAVWMLVPVDIYESANNLVGNVITSLMGACFAMVFIGLFLEFILQIYKKTKLFVTDNITQIWLYGILFFLIFILFIVSHSFKLNFEKIPTSYKGAIGLSTPQLVLGAFGVFMTYYDIKIKPKIKQEAIYE